METARIAADSQLTARPIRSTDPVPTDTPKASAPPGPIRPDGSGWLAVRFTSEPDSASHHLESATVATPPTAVHNTATTPRDGFRESGTTHNTHTHQETKH